MIETKLSVERIKALMADNNLDCLDSAATCQIAAFARDVERAAEPAIALMRLMPEVLAALKNPGPNVSLVHDVEKALSSQPAEPVKKEPAQVWIDLIHVMEADNGGSFPFTVSDYLRAEGDLRRLINAGYFQGDPADLNGDYWQMAAGEETEVAARFTVPFRELHAALNNVFEPSDEPVKVPSDLGQIAERILAALRADDHGNLLRASDRGPMGSIKRALLASYGQPAQPAATFHDARTDSALTVQELEHDPFLVARAWRNRAAPVAAQPSVPDDESLRSSLSDQFRQHPQTKPLIGQEALIFRCVRAAMLAAAPTPPADGQAQQVDKSPNLQSSPVDKSAELQSQAQPATPLLYQHSDGRYGLSFGPAQFRVGDPAWCRVPIDVLEALPANRQARQNGTAGLGIPSCGGPLCSERDHHPLCKLLTIEGRAKQLVQDAAKAGQVVRIDIPRMPLAMGNLDMVVDVRPARSKQDANSITKD